jgi:hypothetical protein
MRRLIEWKDTNGNKVSTTSAVNTASSISSGDYKKRLEKLIDYHIAHKGPDVVASSIKKDIKPYSFHYTEYHRGGIGGYQTDIVGSFETSGKWSFSVFMDGMQTAGKVGSGWDKFVYDISFYLALPPVTTDPEYQDLLTEWVDAKGNKVGTSAAPQSTSSTSSKTNKEKFEELTKYMKAHVNQSVDKAEVVRLDDGGFTYKEHWLSSTGKTFVLTLLVGYSRFNSSWRYELYMDTSLIKELQGSGWEDLLEELEKYFHVPKAGSQEYKNLCESLSIADDFRLYENLWN